MVPPERTVAAIATAKVATLATVDFTKSEQTSAESTQRAPPQLVLPAGHSYQQTGPLPW